MTLDANAPMRTRSLLRVPGRYWRITLALSCLALAGVVGFLHLTNISTSDAVLDGRRIVIRAQISGEVTGKLPQVGTVVNKGQLVALVQSADADYRTAQATQAEHIEIEAKILALDLQRQQLLAVQRQLETEVVAFTNASVATALAQIEVGKANIEASNSDYQVARAEADRARLMKKTGGMGQSDIDQRLGDEIGTQKRLSGAKAELVRLTAEADAFAIGTNSRDGQNNVPYSRQRLDEIAIKLGDIDNQRAGLSARNSSLIAQGIRETNWLISQMSSESLASGPSVVWQRPVAVGTDVSKGDVLVELVDCADMYILARIPANTASVIALGDEVDVTIAGHDGTVPGKVRIVRSLATADPRGAQASGLVAPGAERLAEVEIAVERRAIPAEGGNFCGIGSGAKVRFPVRSILSSLLPTF